ncbi:MAG: uracil-DNA glycosylase [Muribaculaceae bacterium]|nr:uracil-DNA glycosylase [Muribaculaceae bacterium]MDE6643645.1 uracil-DNA glycosylase [Muribaculaceae bacterium]MDE7093022.1 uracil-DNA glycosylase [Muribaculaceae bacterium]
MHVKIEQSWNSLLKDQWDLPYFANLVDFVKHEYATKTIFPPASKIFAAFDSCPADKVKVVIIGQDPYHGPGQANGLCFSVAPGVPLPPSLVNIFKEISDDMGKPMPDSGDLSRWAAQGVLLLNATLTVEAHRAASHQGHGWESFTDCVISRLSSNYQGIVFLLWGNYAISKKRLIDESKHLVLTSVHPSPLSAYRGFLGCRHFSKANQYLTSIGKNPIDW